MKPLLINITGPTATGKTKLGVLLAKKLNTSIINADSRQIYKEMKIGTAVPTEEEKQGIPHYLFQHKSIQDLYTVKDFETEALSVLENLFKQNPYAIAVGGTGLYFNALNYGLDEIPSVPPEIRREILKIYEQKGLAWLQEQVSRFDPLFYQTADIHNPRRLIRALEVIRYTGQPFSAFRKGERKKRPFMSIWFGLISERELLYEKINRRVDRMMAEGLEEEARKLYPFKELPALKTVGYRELFEYFEGQTTREKAVEEIKKNTRRYAKRQITWFKKNKEIHWLNADKEPETLVKEIVSMIKQHQVE